MHVLVWQIGLLRGVYRLLRLVLWHIGLGNLWLVLWLIWLRILHCKVDLRLTVVIIVLLPILIRCIAILLILLVIVLLFWLVCVLVLRIGIVFLIVLLLLIFLVRLRHG